MTSSSSSPSSRSHLQALVRVTPLCLSVALAASCGGTSSSTSGAGTNGLGTPGQEFLKPDLMPFFVDSNLGGRAPSIRLEEMYWGRMVDIYDYTESTEESRLIYERFVIGQDVLPSDDIEIDTDPITNVTNVTILHRKPQPTDVLVIDTDMDGLFDSPDVDGDLIADTEEWDTVFDTLLSGLQQIPFKSDTIGTLGPFDPVARNATVVLRFDDVLDPETITNQTVKTLVGNPPELPFEARVLPDPNHGQLFSDMDGDGENDFRPSRVLIDFTISEFEASLEFPPPAVNPVGLPASPTDAQANISLRIPSRVVFGASQFTILTNLAGNGLATSGNSPVDSSSITQDIVRAFRSGSTDDDNNGFMRDLTMPQVVGQQSVTVANLVVTGACTDCYLVDIQFEQSTCSQTPEAEDIIELPSEVFVQVVQSTGPPNSDGEVFGVTVRDLSRRVPDLIETTDVETGLGTNGQYLSCYDPTDGDLPECFVAFLPTPGSFPSADVDTTAQIRVRFSEPMDPDSVSGLEDFMITRVEEDFGPLEIVPGRTFGAPDLTYFDFTPSIPFSHTVGMAESYFTQLGVREGGITDLAGNPVEVLLPPVEFTIDPSLPTDTNGAFVFRFNDFDEDPPEMVLDDKGTSNPNDDEIVPDDLCIGPDITGQFLFDQERGVLRPRPVTRFAGIIDTANDVQALFTGTSATGMTQNPYDRRLPEPMSPLGARVMALWRYCDMVYSINNSAPQTTPFLHDDSTFYNIDVEGLAWSVIGGAVQADVFDEFEIALAHSARFPDDGLGWSGTGGLFPDTGLDPSSFAINVLGGEDELEVVHDRTRGYVVEPVRAFNVPTGSRMMPYPLNTGNNPELYRYYTWRDTAIQTLGGLSAAGADTLESLGGGIGIPPRILIDELGLYPDPLLPDMETNELPNAFSLQGWIPSVAMPLLMDFRCYPGSGSGSNRPEIILGQSGAAGPTFRISSSGGTDTIGQTFTIDPELQNVPLGGYNLNPNAAATAFGGQTPPGDAVFYTGQVDFVTRVSRFFTRWIPTGGSNVNYLEAVPLPSGQDQPSGTSIAVAYRGASNVILASQSACEDVEDDDEVIPGITGPAQAATILDDYGDENLFRDEILTSISNEQYLYGDPADRNVSISFFNDNEIWSSDPEDINGSVFFQARVSMFGNTESGIVPTLDALALPFDFVD